MTFEELEKKIGTDSPTEIAKFFKLTKGAIGKWKRKNEVPPLRVYELKDKQQPKNQ